MVFLVMSGAARSAPAGFLDVPEKYAKDTGGYLPGKFGQALALANSGNNYLEYPALFPTRRVTEGTISAWFRVTRPCSWLGGYGGGPRFMNLTDGSNQIYFAVITTSGDKKGVLPDYRLVVTGQPGKGINILFPAGFHEQFHHLLYTWNATNALIMLDGAVVGRYDKTGQWPIAFDGTKAVLRLDGSYAYPMILDEYIVMDRFLAESDARGLALRAAPWQPNEHTVLFIPFDGNLNGLGALHNDGDHVRVFSTIQRPGNIFRAGEPVAFTFRAVNFSGDKQKLKLRGVAKDMRRQTECEVKENIQVSPGQSVSVAPRLALKNKGVFWSEWTLENRDGQRLAAERIPFGVAASSAYRRRDSPAGFVNSDGFDPPDFEGWAMIQYVDWRHIEYAPGQYDFEAMDILVDNIVRTGRKPVLHIIMVPDWRVAKRFPAEKYPSWEERSMHPPDSLDDFRAYVRLVGERYKDKVHDYEIWSEGYFTIDADEFAAFANAAAETLHAVNPAIRFGAAMGGYEKWQRTVARKTVGKADYYVIHPYPMIAPNQYKTYDDTDLLKIRQTLCEEGATDKLAATEIHDANLGAGGYDDEGYPLTGEEMIRSGRWAEVLKRSSYFRRYYAEKILPDNFISAGLASRSMIMSVAGGCEYFLWWHLADGIGALIDFPHTPSVKSVGFDNTAGLLASHTYVKRIDPGKGAGYKLYLFKAKAGGEYLLTAWADQETVSVNVNCPSAYGDLPAVLDLWGNPYPHEKIGPLIQLNLTMIPVFFHGLRMPPVTGRPVLTVRMEPAALFPGDPGRITVTVTNPLECVLEGTLTLNLPAAFPKPAEQPIAIYPGQSTNVVLEVKGTPGSAGPGTMEAVLRTGQKGFHELRVKGQVVMRQRAVIAWRTTPIRVDGDLGEWGDVNAFPVVIDKPVQVVVGVPYTGAQEGLSPYISWTGLKDLSAKANLVYDQTNLYIAVRVFDDVVMNPASRTNDNQLWNGDCVELLLDTRHPSARGNPKYNFGVTHLLVAPQLADAPVTVWRVNPADGVLVSLPVSVASRRLDDGYALEIRIPYAIALSHGYDQPGTSIGFDLIVDDQDKADPPVRKTAMAWSGNKNDDHNASQFGRATYGAEPGKEPK